MNNPAPLGPLDKLPSLGELPSFDVKNLPAPPLANQQPPSPVIFPSPPPPIPGASISIPESASTTKGSSLPDPSKERVHKFTPTHPQNVTPTTQSTDNERVPPPSSIPQTDKKEETKTTNSDDLERKGARSLPNYIKAKNEYNKAKQEIEKNVKQAPLDTLKKDLEDKKKILNKVTPYAMKSLKSDMGTIAMIFKGIFFAYEAKKLEYNKLVENKNTAIIKLKEDKIKQIRNKVDKLEKVIPDNVKTALTQVERFEKEEEKLNDPKIDVKEKENIRFQRKNGGREIKGSIKNYTLAENYRKSEVGKLRTQLIAKEKTLKDENITEDEIKAFLSKKKASVHSSGVAAGVLFPFIAIAASAFLPLWGILAIGNAVSSEITGGKNLAGTDVDQDEKISDLSKQAHEKAGGSGA